ncbi:MAG: T9SS type A sorting domain-containing protein [Flavobacterium sp.]|uniref:T9SS type A sorting domain-containing protein n=1 Tax=Flavobacterium sp. TaxID=239 RepID=UPI0026341A2C|nr:choice-of-anchor tandem repeat GloVer-containing protein [Flavobacterium sp.]MDD5150656.1 T9SS type A sorting domain-containing protein [Flavobacterium sp.]
MKKLLLFLVFYLSIGNNLFAQYTKLLDFDGTAKGKYPYGSLYYDGTFMYGMTSIGGTSDLGTVFKIKPDGTEFAKLLDFAGTTNGSNPYGNLISDGTFLYGMTVNGGANNLGTIFKIMPDGTGYAKLLDFADSANGSNPWGSLISDGTFLYGMTFGGGSNSMGTVFKIKFDGTGYTKLLDFAGLSNGRNPRGSLLYDGTYLYGMTSVGGSDNFGTLFKILPNGTGYVKLLNFDSITNGRNPYGALISDGTYLYGMTSGSGTNSSTSFGTIFKITPAGTGYTKLLDFDGAAKGRYPYGSLFSDGTFLYGMTFAGGVDNWGTLFKIAPNGTGFTKLIDFGGTTTGMNPWGSLISVGTSLYGMTGGGGTNAFSGVLFKYGISTLAMAKNQMKNDFKIYPNPTSGAFNIEIDENLMGAKAILYNLLGQKVKDFSLKSTTTNQTLNKGIYLLEIEKDGNKTAKKLIVN